MNETLDAEWEKFTEVKLTSLKIKSAVATSEDGGMKDLKQKIDQLTTVIKSSTFARTKPKKGNAGIINVTNGQYTGKDRNKKPASPYKGQGPTTFAARPFKMDRSHTNVTTVEDGGIAMDSARVRGVSIGGA